MVVSLAAGPAWAQVRPDVNLSKSSPALKSAFTRVIEKASKSTVEITIDAKRAALGTIVSADGYILTKASEVRKTAQVRTKDGREFAAKLVGVVPADDLALLKVSASDLTPVEFAANAHMQDVEPGAWVVTATTSDSPLAVGIVSVNRRKIPAVSGVLGVLLADADNKGAKIMQVLPGSGAEKAGLHVDDIVTEVNGKAVKSRAGLMENVRHFKPGDEVRMKVLRGEKKMDVTAVLGNRPTSTSPLDVSGLLAGPVSKRASAFPVVIQHDTVLRPADCGGPLVDLSGKAIGINIARAGRVESYALPADVIVPLVKDMKAGKYAVGVERGEGKGER